MAKMMIVPGIGSRSLIRPNQCTSTITQFGYGSFGVSFVGLAVIGVEEKTIRRINH